MTFCPQERSLLRSQRENQYALGRKISIEKGNKPLMNILAQKHFFTELDRVGHASFTLALGDYQLKVFRLVALSLSCIDVSYWLLINKQPCQLQFPGQLPISRQHGWYAGDLHHSSERIRSFNNCWILSRLPVKRAGLSIVIFVSESWLNKKPWGH